MTEILEKERKEPRLMKEEEKMAGKEEENTQKHP